MSKPFSKLKVIELTTYVAAPCVGRLLADLGAEVIKIERPKGDGWRSGSINFRPMEFSQEENPIYDYYNAGKKHIVIDLKNPQGVDILMKLLEDADVFLTSTRLGALKRLGIDFDSLKDRFPRLIYAMVEGYGEKGKDADTAAYDISAFWARCGMLLDMAPVDERTGVYTPMYPPSSVGDTVTGLLLLSEINAALYARTETGKGQLCKSGLFGTGVFTFATMQAICQRPYGKVYPMTRYKHGSFYKSTYLCKDGKYIFFYPWTLEKVAELLDRPDFLTDPRFADAEERDRNHLALEDEIQKTFLTQDREFWADRFRESGITFGLANHFADISEDEQALENGYIEEVTYKNGKTLRVAASPISMSEISKEELKTVPAPLTGENTEEVLKKHGYSDNEIKELFDLGVIKPI